MIIIARVIPRGGIVRQVRPQQRTMGIRPTTPGGKGQKKKWTRQDAERYARATVNGLILIICAWYLFDCGFEMQCNLGIISDKAQAQHVFLPRFVIMIALYLLMKTLQRGGGRGLISRLAKRG